MSKKILLIGKPHSSKTVFITQFYIRLQKAKSKLKLYKPVADLSAISASKDALVNGDEPEPTDPKRSVHMVLPIQYNDTQIDLHCPDYGGEQINEIIVNRQIDKNWSQAIRESDNWIFFIRLNSINRQLDISNITITQNHTLGQNTELDYTITEQSSLIELLQLFLHVKQNDYHIQNSKVKLTVVLTCWDELETDGLPKNVLREHLPLLLNFIETNWLAEKVNFIGLSALQFSLNKRENKEKYQIEGSENFGYLIRSTGEKTNDITELICEAL